MSEADDFDLAGYKGALVTREVGRELKHAALVSSTSDVVLAAAGAGARAGLVVLADEQSQGRGRNGSNWVAPPGQALLFSVLLRPHLLSPAAAAQFTFAAAVAIGATLAEGGLGGVELKWPNDVLVGGAKIAGILCESRSRQERLDAVVIGIGVNVNQAAADLPPGAVSIRSLTGAGTDRAQLLAEFLNRLEVECARVLGGRFAEVLAAWQAMSPSHRGRPVRIEDSRGSFEGRSDGLDPDGALRVVRADGSTVRVVSGSARFE